MIKIIAITIVLHVVCCDGFNIESRIINGQKSAPFKYPFYVFLTIYNAEGVEFMCGGTLISDTYVLFSITFSLFSWEMLKTRELYFSALASFPDGF